MPPNPTSDKITECDETNHREHITDKYTSTYDNCSLLKLKNMIISTGNQLSEINSMDFKMFKDLSLDSLKLTYIPINFAHYLTNLSSLNLSNNKLEEIPHSFHQLIKLEHLKIDNNCLVSLPNSLGMLKYLKTLTLSSNQLTQLPENLGCLSNLEVLDLSNNCLTNLPNSFAVLNKLFSLSLENNCFLEIPDCVSNGMRNLHILNISNIKHIFMNKAPASIHLTTFIAKNNVSCEIFPQWILWLKYNKLREVNLDNTQFIRYSNPKERFALQISKLSMKDSNLSDNVVENIISNMVRLEYLDLSNDKYGNRFCQIPFDNMKAFNTLKELNMQRTYLSSVSKKISNFHNLVKLDLSYNRISWLPKEFTKLHNLEVLKLDNSKIIQLPDDIGLLTKLKELWASTNCISNIPNSLYNLKNLEVLDLYDNSILEVSMQISEMSNLKLLDLEQNFIDSSHIMIGNSAYYNLRNALIMDSRNFYTKRLFGVKFDHDLYENDYYSDDDNSTIISVSNEQDDTYDLPQDICSPVNCDTEDWDIPENKTDDFDHDVGLYRSETSYYISTSAHNNYYCPADNHVKPVRFYVAERNLHKVEEFEEGQFDDA